MFLTLKKTIYIYIRFAFKFSCTLITSFYHQLFIFYTFNNETRGEQNRFGSVFIKKSSQTDFFFWKKQPKPVRTGRFRFGSVFLGEKTVWFGFFRFGLVFRFWLIFFRFWLGFFPVIFSVRFYKPKTDTESVGFFKILIGLIGFFFWVGVFGFFFSVSRFFCSPLNETLNWNTRV